MGHCGGYKLPRSDGSEKRAGGIVLGRKPISLMEHIQVIAGRSFYNPLTGIDLNILIG